MKNLRRSMIDQTPVLILDVGSDAAGRCRGEVSLSLVSGRSQPMKTDHTTQPAARPSSSFEMRGSGPPDREPAGQLTRRPSVSPSGRPWKPLYTVGPKSGATLFYGFQLRKYCPDRHEIWWHKST